MNKGTPADPLLAAFDKAVEDELPHVSTIAYNSHDICEWFAACVRKRLAALATKPAEPPYRDEPEQDAVLRTFERAGFRYDGQSLWKASLYTEELLALARALTPQADRDAFEKWAAKQFSSITDPAGQRLALAASWSAWQAAYDLHAAGGRLPPGASPGTHSDHPTESAGNAVQRPMTLAEQVRDAQVEVASWSPERRANVVLEGPTNTQRSSNATRSDEQEGT